MTGKRFFSTLLSCFLVILISVTVLVFSSKAIIANTVSHAIVKDAISSRALDAIYKNVPEKDADQMARISDIIKSSREIDRFTADAFEEAVSSVQEGRSFVCPDISVYMDGLNSKVMDAVSKELGKSLPSGYEARMTNALTAYEDDVEDILTNTVNKVVSANGRRNPAAIKALKAYAIATSDICKVILVGLCILLCALIILLRKNAFEWMYVLGVTSVVSSILVETVIPAILSKVGWAATNRLIGRTTSLALSSMYLTGAVIAIVGIGLCVVYWMMRKRHRAQTF